MYQKYFGIEENPFALTPDPRYLLMTEGHQEALAHLLYGVSESGGFVLLTGEVGTGKTSVCRCLLEQLPPEAEVALILNPKLSEIELLAGICDELGIKHPETRSLKVMVDLLSDHLLRLYSDGRHAVLIVDEAQNLSPDVLEQVRLLTNLETDKRKLLQIILIGQPELDDLLNRRELRQLAQRFTSRTHLQPLNAAETRAYIAHRLDVGGLSTETFSSGACAEVYRRSGGVPRLINSLCDRCLLAAYTRETKRVDRSMVRVAAAEVFGRRAKTQGLRRKIWPGVAATAAVAAVLVALVAPRDAWLSAVMAVDSQVVEASEPPVAGTDRLAGLDGEAALHATPTGPQAAPAAPAVAPAANRPGAGHAGLRVALAGSPAATPAAPPAANRPSAALDGEEAGSNPVPSLRQSAATEPAEPARTATLDELLTQVEVIGDREAALVHLFDLWRRDYQGLAGAEACDKAHRSGLRCLSEKHSLRSLVRLNRPAVLTLETPNGERLHAVLTGLDGNGMTLEAGGRRVRADAKEVAAAWSGEYLLLWRPPTVYRKMMKQGDKGADIAWLKNRLAQLDGEAGENMAEATFDAALKTRVMAFQRSYPLLVDGVVGPQTLIHLNNAVGAPGEAVLAVRS